MATKIKVLYLVITNFAKFAKLNGREFRVCAKTRNILGVKIKGNTVYTCIEIAEKNSGKWIVKKLGAAIMLILVIMCK